MPWTHWDLNPGPSACEADVMPLHHVPHCEEWQLRPYFGNQCICLHTTTNSPLHCAAGPMKFCAFDAVEGYAWPGSGWRPSAREAESTSLAFLLDALVLPFVSFLFSPDAAPPPLAARRRRRPPPSPRARCAQVVVAVGVADAVVGRIWCVAADWGCPGRCPRKGSERQRLAGPWKCVLRAGLREKPQIPHPKRQRRQHRELNRGAGMHSR
jgi:hypothetical protein